MLTHSSTSRVRAWSSCHLFTHPPSVCFPISPAMFARHKQRPTLRLRRLHNDAGHYCCASSLDLFVFFLCIGKVALEMPQRKCPSCPTFLTPVFLFLNPAAGPPPPSRPPTVHATPHSQTATSPFCFVCCLFSHSYDVIFLLKCTLPPPPTSFHPPTPRMPHAASDVREMQYALSQYSSPEKQTRTWYCVCSC